MKKALDGDALAEEHNFRACSRCKEVLSFAHFYNKKRGTGGKSNICIPCAADQQRINTRKRRLYGWKDSRWRYTDPHRQASMRATNRLQSSIRRGQMRRARDQKCVDCGFPAKYYDHKGSYEDPFDVDPVCSICRGLRLQKRHQYPSPPPMIDQCGAEKAVLGITVKCVRGVGHTRLHRALIEEAALEWK